jgi:hypothetical protein
MQCNSTTFIDESIRLLSANGIPKLRAKAKHNLKFKGKGHEVGESSCSSNWSILTILVF